MRPPVGRVGRDPAVPRWSELVGGRVLPLTPPGWVVDPRRETITVHRPDKAPRSVRGDDRLEAPDVLPGWSATVAEILG